MGVGRQQENGKRSCKDMKYCFYKMDKKEFKLLGRAKKKNQLFEAVVIFQALACLPFGKTNWRGSQSHRAH